MRDLVKAATMPATPSQHTSSSVSLGVGVKLQEPASDEKCGRPSSASSQDEDACLLSPLPTTREERRSSILDLHEEAPAWRGDNLSPVTRPVPSKTEVGTGSRDRENYRAIWTHLKRVPWFVGLGDTRTGIAIAKCLTRVDLPAHGSLFHQGEEATGIFFLVQGSIALFQLREDTMSGVVSLDSHKSYIRKVKVVEEFGQVVGEPDLSDPSSQNAASSSANACHQFTAVAEADSKLFHLSKQDYHCHIHSNPARLLQEKMDMIDRIPLFAKASATFGRQALESIASTMSIQRFPAHAVVGTKGHEARLFIIVRGAIDVREPPDLGGDSHEHKHEEVIIEPPNQRERVGKLGLRQRAAISRLTERSYFGLSEALSQKAQLQHEYRCAVPTDVICIGKEEARRMVYAKWLTESKADLERIGPWHDARLQGVRDTKELVGKVWGYQPMVQSRSKPKVEFRPPAFTDVTQELWGNPPGQSGLPMKNDAAPEPTPKMRRVMMKSVYAMPEYEELVSSAEATLVASMRLNPDSKLRLTVKSPLTKIRGKRPWGAKNVLGTNTMIVPAPIKIPTLDLHKVRQSRRRNHGKGELLSERHEDLKRALKQATIHRYRTADGVDKTQHALPPTAASRPSQLPVDDFSRGTLPVIPSQLSQDAEWRALTPVTSSLSPHDCLRLSSASEADRAEYGEGIDFVMKRLDSRNYHLVPRSEEADGMFVFSGERGTGVGVAEAALIDAEGDNYSDGEEPPTLLEDSVGDIQGGAECIKNSAQEYGIEQKFPGYLTEKPDGKEIAESVKPLSPGPLRRSMITEQLRDVAEAVLKFSRGYDEDAHAPKQILKISGVQESEESGVEDVLKVIFRGLDVTYMALYEGNAGQVSDAVISFDSEENGEKALKIAQGLGLESELLTDKRYRAFHERTAWELQSLDLPDKALANLHLDTNKLPPTAGTLATLAERGGSQSARTTRPMLGKGFASQRPGAATARQLEKRTVSHFDFGRETSDWDWIDKVQTNRIATQGANYVRPKMPRQHRQRKLAKPVQQAEDHPFMRQNLRQLWATVLPHIK